MEGLYTVTQMVSNSGDLLFFNLFSEDGNWDKLDLNEQEPLFTALPMLDIMRYYTERVIPPKKVKVKADIQQPTQFIWPKDNPEWRERALADRLDREWILEGGWSNKGGQLRTASDNFPFSSGALNTTRQLIADIDPDDQDTLLTTELASLAMFSLIERLVLIHVLGHKIVNPFLVRDFPDSDFLKFPNWERTFNPYLYNNDEFKEPGFEELHLKYLIEGLT